VLREAARIDLGNSIGRVLRFIMASNLRAPSSATYYRRVFVNASRSSRNVIPGLIASISLILLNNGLGSDDAYRVPVISQAIVALASIFQRFPKKIDFRFKRNFNDITSPLYQSSRLNRNTFFFFFLFIFLYSDKISLLYLLICRRRAIRLDQATLICSEHFAKRSPSRTIGVLSFELRSLPDQEFAYILV